jgi:hypothetical protein
MLAASAGAGLVALAFLLGLYFLPSIVAKSRGVSSVGSVFIINLFLGWTFIGWVVALAMAFRSPPSASVAPQVTPASPSVDWSTSRRCPHCKEAMKRDATVCPRCHRESKAWVSHDGRWWIQDESGSWQWLDEAANTWTLFAPAATPSALPSAAASQSVESDSTVVTKPNPTPAVADVAGAGVVPNEELERLTELHTRGILTDAEFESAKSRVLGAAASEDSGYGG